MNILFCANGDGAANRYSNAAETLILSGCPLSTNKLLTAKTQHACLANDSNHHPETKTKPFHNKRSGLPLLCFYKSEGY